MPERRHVAVVGAGIVGMSCALALAERSFDVTLIDPEDPGTRTSRWNAGVLATSSLIPLCNPGVFRRLPGLALGRYAGFRFDWSLAPSVLPWVSRFLLSSRRAPFERTAVALNALIGWSRMCHAALLNAAGARDLLVEDGWLVLFRDPAAWRKAEAGLGFYERHGVAADSVSGSELAELEPALRPVHAGALRFSETAAVRDPYLVMQAYRRLLAERGIRVRRDAVQAVTPKAMGGVRLTLATGTFEAGTAIIAAGAWSAPLLRPFGTLPLVVERGYLCKYQLPGAQLSRPVFDSERGIVLSPRPEGVQLSTGTELTRLGAAPSDGQFRRAEASAREIVALGDPVMTAPEIGERPSLPDGLPAIGPLRKAPGIIAATGHQHVGFSTGPATGEIVADLLTGTNPRIDIQPFSPARFGL